MTGLVPSSKAQALAPSLRRKGYAHSGLVAAERPKRLPAESRQVGPATESRLKRSFAACPRALPAHTTTPLAGETAAVPVQHHAAVALKQRYDLLEAYRPKGVGLDLEAGAKCPVKIGNVR